jgi:hypothetical protein
LSTTLPPLGAPLTRSAPRGEPRRRVATWEAIFVGVSVVVAVVLFALPPVHRAPPPAPVVTAPPAPEPPPSQAPQLTVVGTRGRVERADRGGAWGPLSVGERVLPEEQVRTGPGASAALSAGDRSHLALGEGTELTLRELSDELHRYRVSRGVVTFDYLPEGRRVVRIEGLTAGSPSAEARAARFHVVAGKLSFAVATETGGVSLSAAGGTVEIPAGHSSLSRAGLPPTPPAEIPKDVLLKVASAKPVSPSGPCALGRTDPGSLVTVNEVEVPVAPDGRFLVRAPRSAGETVTVRAVLPDGHATAQTIRCPGDAEAIIKDLRMRWDDGGP